MGGGGYHCFGSTYCSKLGIIIKQLLWFMQMVNFIVFGHEIVCHGTGTGTGTETSERGELKEGSE